MDLVGFFGIPRKFQNAFQSWNHTWNKKDSIRNKTFRVFNQDRYPIRGIQDGQKKKLWSKCPDRKVLKHHP